LPAKATGSPVLWQMKVFGIDRYRKRREALQALNSPKRV